MNRLDRMKEKGLIKEYDITGNFITCDYKVMVIFEFNYRKYYIVLDRVSHQELNYSNELEEMIKHEIKNVINKI